jgi:hypothetical protein
MTSSVPVNLQIENLTGTQPFTGTATGIILPDRAGTGDTVFIVTAQSVI